MDTKYDFLLPEFLNILFPISAAIFDNGNNLTAKNGIKRTKIHEPKGISRLLNLPVGWYLLQFLIKWHESMR